MPLVSSGYTPPLLYKNGHFSTIYSGLFRKINGVIQDRSRLELSDGDFIDLDWSFSGIKTNKVVVLLHGLEGDAQRSYMLGSAKIFTKNNFDVISVNFRGCSGEENRLYRSYHSGETEDLRELISHIAETTDYDNIFIKGYSLGGNVAMKFLGENKFIHSKVKAGMAVAVPCDLYGSCVELHKFKNKPYAMMFKHHLLKRLRSKLKRFPKKITKKQVNSIKTLKDFDDVYTSRAHGFTDALDYYKKSSSLQFLKNISVPTLILNAKNDSFLSPSCFPINEAKTNDKLFLEIPDYGGHVGYYSKGEFFYDEFRGVQFFNNFKKQ